MKVLSVNVGQPLVFRALLAEAELLPRLLVADTVPSELKEMARSRTA